MELFFPAADAFISRKIPSCVIFTKRVSPALDLSSYILHDECFPCELTFSGIVVM